MFPVIARREVAPNVHEIVIEAPEIARKALPGQFCIAMVDAESERVPYTLSDWEPATGQLTLVVLEAGQSSRKMISLASGEAIHHIVGPLGEPLAIERVGSVVLAAGCYGIGAILSIARGMKAAGNHVTAIVEARSAYVHYYREKLMAVCDELIQTTVDGSDGIKGHAVGVIRGRLERGETPDLVVAVGCPFMMMLTGKATEASSVRTLVALNPIMLDGTGMCGACRVSVGGQMKFACVDGPFFDAHAVDWSELRDRKAAYGSEEIAAVAHTGATRGHHPIHA